MIRERLIEACEQKVLTPAGLIAQGRGEAFDYLIGEKTQGFAREAAVATAAAFLCAQRPVISVNGNAAALCASDLVKLSKITHAPLEVNLFYRAPGREEAIEKLLKSAGADTVLGVGEREYAVIPELSSDRRRVDPDGILVADLVLVPLEDGDRTEALIKMGKTVIAIDLNPLSRTAEKATITIVDNITRALPLIIDCVEELKDRPSEEWKTILTQYDNKTTLKGVLTHIAHRMEELARRE
jgi:4-phosphopantoate--beta-alanine ligase